MIGEQPGTQKARSGDACGGPGRTALVRHNREPRSVYEKRRIRATRSNLQPATCNPQRVTRNL
jgi:hypothetical protein